MHLHILNLYIFHVNYIVVDDWSFVEYNVNIRYHLYLIFFILDYNIIPITRMSPEVYVYEDKTRYKCCAQHNGRVANYCHVPLVIRRVHITSTPQAIHLLALCGEVINIHLRTKKDRSRTSIFELEIHPWYKFGINATNID